MKSKKPPHEQPSWAVFLLRKKAERIGRVEAKDQAAAMAKAIEEFQIRPADQMRVSVQRE